MVNLVQSAAGAATFALKPWHRPPNAAHLYAFPFRPLDGAAAYQEVEMTVGGFKGVSVIPELGVGPQDKFCLWTGNASGGCTPFGVIVRHRRNRQVAEAMALAHLCFNPVPEAEWLGRAFANLNAEAHDVYLVVMKIWGAMLEYEAGQYFEAFETGFGRWLPDQNKTVLVTDTFHAAVNMDGYFGEVSGLQQQALFMRRYPQLTVGQQRPMGFNLRPV